MFPIFAQYFATFKKTVTKRSCSGAEDKTLAIRLGKSAFEGTTSSLSHLYLECGLKKENVSKDLWAKSSTYKKGSTRTAASERKKLEISTVKGKKTFAVCGVPPPCKAFL